MSHLVKIKTIFKDFDALCEAFKICGMELMLDQHTYRWFDRWVGDTVMPEGFTWKPSNQPNGYTTVGPRFTHTHDPKLRMLGTCDHAFRVAGDNRFCTYDAGVYQNPDGTWGVVWDYYGMGGQAISKRLGTSDTKPNAEKLESAYALIVAERTAQAQGWTTRREGDQLFIDVYDPATGTMGTVTVGKGGVDATGFTGGACANPVDTISNALGIQTESQYKPEYYETNWLEQQY